MVVPFYSVNSADVISENQINSGSLTIQRLDDVYAIGDLQYDKYTHSNKKAYMIDDYLYIFNAEATPVTPDSDGIWLDAADSLALETSVRDLSDYAPNSGTSLVNAFSVLSSFDKQPDNIFLLTDGLPTMSESAPKKYMVTGGQRRKHFNVALTKIPVGISVNTILFPMEGDPEAAALYWQLALDTEGAFIAPSRDWP